MPKGLLVAVVVVMLALAGSTPAGAGRHQITPDDLAQFKVGVTTEPDVVAKLGKPSSISVLSDGTQIIAYVGIKTRVKAATFVPIVGLFAGGATGETSVATFTFGPDGRLQSSSATNSNVNCSVGIVSAGCEGSQAAPAPARARPPTQAAPPTQPSPR